VHSTHTTFKNVYLSEREVVHVNRLFAKEKTGVQDRISVTIV